MIFKKELGIYYRRPLFLLLTAVLASFALCLFFEGLEKLYCALVLSALSLCAFLLLLVPRMRKASFLFFAVTLLFSAIPFYSSYVSIDLQTEELCDKRYANATFCAEELLSESSYGAYYRVHLSELDDQTVSCNALLFISRENKLKKNEIVNARVKITPLKDDKFSTYYMADGLLVKLEIEKIYAYGGGGEDYLTKESSSLALAFSRLFENELGEKEGALYSALFLGNKSSLDAKSSLDFQRLGISHLIAVSGLHISILIFGIERLLRRLTVHKTARSILCVLLLLFYLSIIGFPISAVRASLMYCTVLLSYFMGRRYDSMTALAFVAVLLCFSSPYTVYDVAFWLSVTATAGVLIVLDKNEAKNPNTPLVPKVPIVNLKTFFLRVLQPLITYIKTSFLISFGAICATFPITAFVFGDFPLLGALATLLLSPLVTVMLYGACLLPLLQFIPFESSLLKGVAKLAFFIIERLSSFEMALIPLDHPMLKLTLFSLIASLLFMKILPFAKKKHRRLAHGFIALVLLCTATVTLLLPMRERYVTYERDSAKESFCLYDRGHYSLFLFDTMQYDDTLNQLDSYGCTYLQNLCLSGYTETLYVQIDSLVSKIKTERVLLGAPTDEKEALIAEKVSDTLKIHGVTLAFYEKNKPFALTKQTSFTDFDCPDNRQTYLLDAHGTYCVFTVPEKVDAAVSPQARALYSQANMLVIGRRWVNTDEYLLTGTSLPELQILINANAYGTLRLPESETHSFYYYKAPTLIRYRFP